MRIFFLFNFLILPALILAQPYNPKDYPNISICLQKKLKQTKGGKAIAPVIDIQPQLRGKHDYQNIREELLQLKALGFERLYFVLCQPGYPAFSDPTISVMPPRKKTGNSTFRSILALGDPNWAYLYETKKLGMEAWAIIKPYECGSGFTVPHGKIAPFSSSHVKTIGGQHIYFDNLLSDNPELRVLRKPLPDSIAKRINQPVESLEIAFCLDTFKQKTGHARYFEFEGLTDTEVQIPQITLWISKDNGKYVKHEGNYALMSSYRKQRLKDSNGFYLGKNSKRFLVLTIKDLEIPIEYKYIAITLNKHKNLYTIPFSMIKAFSSSGEIPSTAGIYVRNSLSPIERNKPYRMREWGLEGGPVRGEAARNSFADWGFEFEFQGTGHWGDGWVNSPVYGIAIGKRKYLAGTPCEAYPEVQDYWLEQVRRVIAMGFDGIDFRLQNHSSMTTDFTFYGYNDPLVKSYNERYGIDILSETADPMKIMKVRGDYFLSFLEKAAKIIHSSQKKMQIHLRHAYEDPVLSDDFNELGFWAMPKVLLDWKKAVDLADEVTLKHYYHGNYRSWMGDSIKSYAYHKGKRVWVHNYFTQGDGINDTFFDSIEMDDKVGGILLYEVNQGILNTGYPNPERGYVENNVVRIKETLTRLEFK